MSYKLTCPGCDRYTSAVFHAYSDGYPCPYCGHSLSAATAQYYRQLLDDHQAVPSAARLLPPTPLKLPARRKWIVRREGSAPYQPWHGWIVTAPSGRRRWFYTWSMMRTMVPSFVMGEQSPGLRELAPLIYDSGVPV